jgi:hypothetical protein
MSDFKFETNTTLRTKAAINSFLPTIASVVIITAIYGFSVEDKYALSSFFMLFFSTGSGAILIMCLGVLLIGVGFYFLYEYTNDYIEDLAGYTLYKKIIDSLGDKAADELTLNIYKISSNRLLSDTDDLSKADKSDIQNYIDTYVRPATTSAVDTFYKYYGVGFAIAVILIGITALVAPRSIGLPVLLILIPLAIPAFLTKISEKIQEAKIGDKNLELYLNLYKQLNIYEERFKSIK